MMQTRPLVWPYSTSGRVQTKFVGICAELVHCLSPSYQFQPGLEPLVTRLTHSTVLWPTWPMYIAPVKGSKVKRQGFRMPTAQNSVRTLVGLTETPLKLVAPTNGLSGGIE